jgi:glycosyltransferase involved in cell wall biosynthesis
MEILLYGEYFLPIVGGVQTSLALLAEGLANHRQPADGCGPPRVNVTLVTRTPAGQMDDPALPYGIVRKPDLWRLIQLIWRSDVVHLAGPCFLPLLLARLIRKAVVIEHHGYQAACLNGTFLMEPSHAICPGHLQLGNYRECIRCGSQTMGRLAVLRALALSFPRRWLCKGVAANVTITNHVALRLKLPKSRTIYYRIKIVDATMPTGGNAHGPTPQISYVGRLVNEKGLPVLLQAA